MPSRKKPREEYGVLQARLRAQREAWGERPPVKEWRRGDPLPEGFVQEDDEFSGPCAVPGLRAVFGRREWSSEVEFRRYVSPDGIRIGHGDQYDGFGHRSYLATLPDGRTLSASPRTTRRGTFFHHQLRWFGSPASALRAARAALSVVHPDP